MTTDRTRYRGLLFWCFVICILTAHDLCSAGGKSTTSQEDHEQELVRRILLGDGDAITEAKTNNTTIPYLRAKLAASQRSGSNPWSTQVALAKVGNREQMDNIVCQLYDKKVNKQNEAVQKLEQVGGYASINVFGRMLADDVHMRNRDLGEGRLEYSLQMLAVRALAKLVPQMPIPAMYRLNLPTRSPTDEQLLAWRNWLVEHRDDLIQLEPVEGGQITQQDCLARRNKANLKRPNQKLQRSPQVEETRRPPGEKP